VENFWFGNPEGLSERDESVYALLCRHFDDRPINAREIAEACGIAPKSGVEIRKRRVRECIERIREKGAPICATLDDGYWLAVDGMEFRRWCEWSKSGARGKFARARRLAGAVADQAAGQGRLFAGGSDGVDVFRR